MGLSVCEGTAGAIIDGLHIFLWMTAAHSIGLNVSKETTVYKQSGAKYIGGDNSCTQCKISVFEGGTASFSMGLIVCEGTRVSLSVWVK